MSRAKPSSDFVAGGTFDLGRKLRVRLAEANDQRERTQAKINQLSDQLQRMFSKAPKKPRESQEQMDTKIEKLEYQRTTSSLTLSQEKHLLRQIDVIKKSKKTLEEYHVHELSIQEKKNEISALRDSLRTVSAAIAELESALSKVELAKRLGCTTAELQTLVVDCPEEKIGHIIGKNGSSLKQLEQRTGVQIDVDKVGSKIHLQGSASALEAAVREVEQITLAVEEELKLEAPVVSYFLAQKSAILSKLQAQHPFVHFDLSKVTNTLTLRGRPEFIVSAKKDIRELDIQTLTHTLSSREIGLVVGKGGATVNKLVAKHGVFVNVASDGDASTNATVQVTGGVPNIKAALSEIESILYENEEIEESIMVNPMQRNMFLSNSGAILKEIQAEISGGGASKGGTGALLLFEKRDKGDKPTALVKEPSKLFIRTSRFNMENAMKIVEQRISAHEATVITIEVGADMVPAIIGKGGATINALRQEGPGAEIEIEKSTGTIRIQANEESARQSIKESIEKIVSENQVLHVDVERAMIGLIFGESGKEIKKAIIEDLGVWMGVDSSDEHIILRGTTEKIEEAAVKLNEFYKDNYVEELEINPEDESILFRSGEDNIMTKVSNDHSVTATYRKSSQKIIARGREENVKAAMVVLKRFMFGGDDFYLCRVKVPESALGIVIGKGGSHIAKLEKDFEGVSVDLLRSNNYLSIRGPEETVKKCRSTVISLVATAKVYETISIDKPKYDMLNKPDVMKKVNEGLSVQLTITESNVKIRGLSTDVKDAKSRLLEQITGVFSSSIELEPGQFNKAKKALKDESHLTRIHDSTKASLCLDSATSSLLISGKRSAVKKAKNQLYGVLDFLLPSELVRIKLSKPLLKFLSDAEYLANVTADTGAYTLLDRELTSLVIRSENLDEVKQAATLVNKKISDFEKLNYVLKLDTQESWLLPRVIGKNGFTINSMQSESSCSFDIYKEELTIAITGQSPEAVMKGKELLHNVIEKAKRECIFIDIPEGAMPSFIGKSGSNVRQIAEEFRVDIDRTRKDSGAPRVKIHGDEYRVEEARVAVLNWIKDWRLKNMGETISIPKEITPNLSGSQRFLLTNIMEETGCSIDLDRKAHTIVVRGSQSQITQGLEGIKSAIKKMQEHLDKEKAVANNVNAEDPVVAKETKVSSPPYETPAPLVTKPNNIKAEIQPPQSVPDVTQKVQNGGHVEHKTNGGSKVGSLPTTTKPPMGYSTSKKTPLADVKPLPATKAPPPKVASSLVGGKVKANSPKTSGAANDLFQLLVSDTSMLPQRKFETTSSGNPAKIAGPNDSSRNEDNGDPGHSAEAQKPYYKSASGFTVRV